jgi:hypothetical protein
MHARKVVLASKSGYNPARDDLLLRELVANKIELFCAVGIDAEQWEEAIDWLCMGSEGDGTHFICTTSHPNESEEQVIEFALSFATESQCHVEIIRV